MNLGVYTNSTEIYLQLICTRLKCQLGKVKPQNGKWKKGSLVPVVRDWHKSWGLELLVWWSQVSSSQLRGRETARHAPGPQDWHRSRSRVHPHLSWQNPHTYPLGKSRPMFGGEKNVFTMITHSIPICTTLGVWSDTIQNSALRRKN